MRFLTNPVVFREFIRHIRRPRTFRSLFTLLCIGFIVFCATYYIETNNNTLSQINGRDIFFPIMYILCFLGFPLATLASSGIVQERESETLDLLLTTPLKSFSIIWGKCSANLMFILMMAVSTLPFLSLCFLLGGISPKDMYQSFAAIMGFYILSASVGVFVSMFSVSSASAARVSIWLLILFMLSPFALTFLLLIFGIQIRFLLGFTVPFWFNPFIAIYILYNPSAPLNIPGNSLFTSYFISSPGIITFIQNVVFSLFFLLITTLIFHKFSAQFSTRFSWKALFPSWQRKRPAPKKINQQSTDFLSSFSTRRRSVYEKELISYNRKWMTNSRILAITCVFVAVGISILFWVTTTNSIRRSLQDSGHVKILIGVFGVVIACFFSHIAPSFSILVERRKETWPLLRTTTVRSMDIIKGKVFGCVMQAAIPFLALILSFYLSNLGLAYIYGYPPKSFLVTEITILSLFYMSCIFFYSSTGVMFSSQSKKEGLSPARKTFGLVMFHLFLPTLIAGSIMWIRYLLDSSGFYMGPFDFYRQLFTYIQFVSPISVVYTMDWDWIHYVIIIVQTILLLTMGYLLMFSSSAFIRKRF